MVPSGSKECIPRRYERLLANTAPLYMQAGLKKKADRFGEILAGMMKGPLKVLNRPSGSGVPECMKLYVTFMRMISRLLNTSTRLPETWSGSSKSMNSCVSYAVSSHHSQNANITMTHLVQVPEMDWRFMQDHIACHFTELPFWDPVGLECFALHLAKHELKEIGIPWSDWYFPIGQKIEICLLQIDARLGAIHRRDSTHKCIYSPCFK